MADSIRLDAVPGRSRRLDAATPRRASSRSILRRLARRCRRDPLTAAALAFMLAVTAAVSLAPIISPHDPYEVDYAHRLGPIGSRHYVLGTDELGRDIFSRLLWGGRISLLLAVVPTIGAVLLGAALGLIAGYCGGWIDHVVMRALDVLMAFPYILLAIGIAAALGPGMFNAILAVTIIGIPVVARLMRSAVLVLREQEFVMCARVTGAGTRRILLRHLLPNGISVLIVYGTLNAAHNVIASASLGFLGLGVQPPQADWGGMLASGRSHLLIAPHVATIPGIVIFATALAFNVLGEACRDVLDPRLSLS